MGEGLQTGIFMTLSGAKLASLAHHAYWDFGRMTLPNKWLNEFFQMIFGQA